MVGAGLVLFGCTPSGEGGSSGLSNVYLLEFDLVTVNQTTRLRVGYTCMSPVG